MGLFFSPPNHPIAIRLLSRSLGMGAMWVVALLIVQRIKTEAALRESEHLQRAILDNIPDPAWMKDRGGRFVAVNKAWCTFMGLTPEKALGRTSAELFPAEEALRLQEQDSDVVKSARPQRSEHFLPDVRGDIRAFEDFRAPVIDPVGNVLGTVGVARDITERNQVEQALVRSHGDLRALARRLSEIDEAERKRLSQELHDRVGQALAVLGINLTHLAESLPSSAAPEVGGRVKACCLQAESLAEDVRNVMTELRPPALDDFGLMAAVRGYGQGVARRSGISVVIDEVDEIGRLPPDRETAIFRIIQEALANVLRHSGASEVCITCEANPAARRIVVADNGSGFDIASAKERRTSWGLTIMRERPRAVGCEVSVNSRPRFGTSVIVDIPASA